MVEEEFMRKDTRLGEEEEKNWASGRLHETDSDRGRAKDAIRVSAFLPVVQRW